MSRSLTLAFLFAGLAFAACSKKNDDATPTETGTSCSKYVAGDVLVGIKPDVETSTVFSWINALGLRIDRVNGFTYISNLPADSLAYIKRTLLAKPYLNARGFTGGSAFVYNADHKIRITDFQFDMTPANQADWLQTMQTIQLTDEGGARCQACKDIYLKVPVGSEKYWLQELAQNSNTRWVELNCYSRIILF